MLFRSVACRSISPGHVRRYARNSASCVPLIPSHPAVASKIQVFDVTDDISSILITMHHIIIKRVEDTLEVVESMRLKNTVLMAVKPQVKPGYEKPAAIEIFLPKSYRNFQALSYFNQNDLVWTNEGFYDPVPVSAGEADVQFSYVLDIDSTALDISKKFSLPTDECALFLALPEAKPQNLGAAVTSMTWDDGTVYDYYQLGPRQPGDITNIQLVGFTERKADLTWIILGLVFLVVIVVVFLRLKTKKT